MTILMNKGRDVTDQRSLVLCPDERRRFDDDERDRVLRSVPIEFCRVCGRALGFSRPILIATRP